MKKITKASNCNATFAMEPITSLLSALNSKPPLRETLRPTLKRPDTRVSPISFDKLSSIAILESVMAIGAV